QSLSLSRRTALLEWADRKSAWVVEDDYDSEFRYAGPPLPSLKSLDTVERVLYLGTFSKVLSPSLGVGYLVVPRQLVERLSAVARLLQPPPAPLIQNAIASFMREGHFGRHIGRMRRLYGERRDALHAALRRASPSLVTIRGPGGMHLLCLLPAGTDDMAVAISVRERGLYPAPLSWYHVERPQPPGLLLGFTNVEVDQADAVARRFIDTLRKQGLHV